MTGEVKMNDDKGRRNHRTPGRAAAKRRRRNALATLQKVEKPDKRQLAEIEVLEQKIAHG